MRTLTQAVHEKYSDDDSSSSDNGIILYVPRSSPRRRLPSVLVLDHCEIDSVGDEHYLESDCCAIRELDISHNNIKQWEEVNKLVCSLPNLTFLNLSFNPLGGSSVINPSACFSSLKQLILNRSGIQWDELAPYLLLAPNLEELHLSFNDMKIPLEKEETFNFSKITTLHYDGNKVENRDHLMWISNTFPSLTTLVLCECPLWTFRWTSSALRAQDMQEKKSSGSSSCDSDTSSCYGDGKSSSCCAPSQESLAPDLPSQTLFPFLRSVSLNHCHVDCWEEVGQLRLWPSLTELRMQSCPLFQKLTEHERRQLTIARLPNIQRLNGGCQISAQEREGAERHFIRQYQDREIQPARFTELMNLYGEVQKLVDVCLRPPKTVDVWVRWGEQRWLEKKISLYLTLKELKERFSFTLGIPSSKLRIFHFDQCQPHTMTFPAKRLYSYNVRDGDEFIVSEKL
nr:EOG090X05JJ [Sida crystallina]